MEEFTNEGIVKTSNGGILTLPNQWSNSGGTIIANDGGIVNLTGTLDNNNSSLNLDGTNGTVNLNGGQILGGVINISETAKLNFTSSSNNRLSGVTINGNLEGNNDSAQLHLDKNFNLNGTLTMRNRRADLWLDGSQTISQGTFILEGTDGTFERYQELIVSGEDGTVSTLGEDVIVTGGYARILSDGEGTQSLVNQGLIEANISGKTLQITVEEFTNEGIVKASNGGILALPNQWSNSGGTIIANDGGIVNLTGTLDNNNGTVNLDTNGALTLNGGQIIGGVINISETAKLNFTSSSNNRLSGVTINGNLEGNNDSAQLHLDNSFNLNGTLTMRNIRADLWLDGSQTISQGRFIIEGTQSRSDRYQELIVSGEDGTVSTLGEDVIVSGGYARILSDGEGTQSLVNQGLIEANISGKTLQITVEGFTNEGTVKASNGGILNLNNLNSNTGEFIVEQNSTINLTQDYNQTDGVINLQGGTFNATGIITLERGLLIGEGTITTPEILNQAQVNPGQDILNSQPIGTITVDGNYTQTETGILNLELEGTNAGEFDQLVVSDVADLDGILNVSLIDVYLPSIGDSFDILTFAEQSGGFANINLPTLGNGLFFQAKYEEDSLTLIVTGNEPPTAIALSNSTIDENPENGQLVGTLTTDDLDPEDTHTYTLLNSADGRFAIEDDRLIVADGSRLDYESNSSHTVTIRSTDNQGFSWDQEFTINLNNLVEPGKFAFNGSIFIVEEGGNAIAPVNLTRTEGSDVDVDVTLTLTDGSAILDDDYSQNTVTVTFLEGETSKNVSLPLIDDDIIENIETINLEITSVSAGTIDSQIDTPHLTYRLKVGILGSPTRR